MSPKGRPMPSVRSLGAAGAGPAAISGPMIGTMLVAQIAALAYNLFVLNTVSKLQHSPNCPCAQDWKLEFVRKYTLFILSWLVGVMLVGMVSPKALMHPAFAVAGNLVSIASVANLAIALLYIQGLRQGKCQCSASIARSVWEALMWVQAGLVALQIVLAVLVISIAVLLILRHKLR